MNRKKWMIAVLLVVVVAIGWYVYHGRSAANAPKTEAAPPSVEVKTQRLAKKMIADIVPVFGEVQSGKTESVSLPRSGQITRLEVVLGQHVRQGAVLAVFTTDAAAQTGFSQAADAVRFAQAELERIRQLFSLQLATQSQLDAARKTLQDAQAALNAQKKVGAGQPVETVTAPFDALVTGIPVAQGDRLQPGAPIVQLSHIDGLRVYLGIEPAQRARVRPGLPVTLSPAQRPNETIETTVQSVQDAIDPKTQLVNALVVIPAKASARILAGMRVEGGIEVGQTEAWGVPRQAVLSDEQGSYVFQVMAGKAHRVNVKEAGTTAGITGIEGKLDPSAPVVILGNYELQDSMAVRESAR